MIDPEYRIESADTAEKYEGLKALWCGVFGDEPAYVDSFYKCFGSEIKGYVVTDRDGRICSGLTCYRCGTFEGKDVFVSYAVCTAPGFRGRGLAGALTAYVRDEVITEGGISLVSPAEPSLEDFYGRLGYEPFFFAAERAVMSPAFDDGEFDFDEEDDFEAFKPEIRMEALGRERYSRYREAFLAGRPHIELSENMLRMIESETAGGAGLFSINNGDAVCALESCGNGITSMTELIVSPVLLELSLDIDNEIASMCAAYFGDAETVFVTPGCGRCQSMIAGFERHAEEETPDMLPEEAYFGFPID